jgi:RND family efflux transporter MFP subunit
LSQQLELKTDLIRAAAEAEAAVASADAMLRQAQVSTKEAQLRLDRMTVKSPIDGKVLALVARPGMRVMGEREAAVVASLYDPQRLQVRADVRLEDVPHLAEGQPVALRTAALEQPLDGRVLQVTSITDIQKNTLQVKIEIPDPPAVLKPEMLVEATFLAPKPAASESAGQERLTTYVPASLVQQTEAGAAVWLVDQAAGLARQKPIKLGIARQGALVEVQGVSPADKVIATGHASLEDGDRVRIIGEEPAASTSLSPDTAAASNSSAHRPNQHSN